VIKNDEFRRKINTEFFGVDIPVYLDSVEGDKSSPEEPRAEAEVEEKPADVEDGFFMTGVEE